MRRHTQRLLCSFHKGGKQHTSLASRDHKNTSLDRPTSPFVNKLFFPIMQCELALESHRIFKGLEAVAKSEFLNEICSRADS